MKRRDFFGALAAAVAAPKLLSAGEANVVAPDVVEITMEEARRLAASKLASGYVIYEMEATSFDDDHAVWVRGWQK